MNNRITGGFLIGLGIAVILVGLALRFVIVPGFKQFPDDVDTTRYYQSVADDSIEPGVMKVLLNAATFEFMTDFEVDLIRHFSTEETDGDVALVREEQTLIRRGAEGEEGQPLQSLVKHYAIDRKTMLATDNFPEEWAALDGFWDREGLVLGWPIDTEKKDYDGWSDDYRAIVPLVFVEELKHDRSGMDVYLFTASSETQNIHPDHVATLGLPLELPKEQFAELIQGANVSDSLKRLLPALLTQWENDTIPLQYYYAYEGEYWIEPQTGVLIDTRKHEVRKVGLGDDFLALSPMLSNMTEEQREASRVTVFDLTYQSTDQSVEDAKNDAQDVIDTLNLFSNTLPLIAVALGIVLIALGGFLFTRKPAASA